MHQQQWLGVMEDMGGDAAPLPIPNSFDQSKETQEFSYAFFATAAIGASPEAGRWTHGRAPDGKGEFSVFQNKPLGEVPHLGPARPDSGAETQPIV